MVSPAGIESGPSNENSFAVKLTIFGVAAAAGTGVAVAAVSADGVSVLAQDARINAAMATVILTEGAL
jgi:hypothetical protein